MVSKTRTNLDVARAESCSQYTEASAHDVEWLLAVAHRGQTRLYSLRMNHRQTGTTAMNLVRREYEAIKPLRRWFHTRLVLEEATISPLCIGDEEAQDYPREVIVDTSTPSPDLTKAFKNPRLLRGSSFALMNSRLVSGKGPCFAILFRTTISKSFVISVLVAVFLLSAVIGCVTGIWTKDAQVGFGVSAGIVGIIAVVQMSFLGIDIMKAT